MENDIIILDSVEQFNRQCGFETLHPLVTVVDMAKSTGDYGSQRMHYRLYALWLKNGEGCRLKYGRCYYDYDEGSVVSFAPGQVIKPEPLSETPQSVGLLFHPDLIHGTSLSRKMERYTFFSYNEGWNKTSALPWLNAGFLKFTNEIDNAVLILHGEKAHSRYFGITAYENMTGEKVNLQGQDANLQPLNEPLAEPFIVTRGNKQLYIVPNATHCDIYDGGEGNYIPFDYLENFYKDNLK